MEIRKRFEDDIVVLYISGKIDINSASLIEETGHLVKEGVTKILCNFQNVEMIDYNGLSILAIAYKNVDNQKSALKLCSVPQHINELFKSARLDMVFEMFPDEETALEGFHISTKVDKLSLRRRFKRIDTGLPVKYKIGLSTDEKLFKGKILNLSAEGLFIYTKNTFPAATELYIEIALKGVKEPFTFTGTVLWLADRELQPHSYPGMGIQFSNLDELEQNNLIAFIDKNLIGRSKS
ncbi:MAG: PilZ domain-containing protein [Candidatus Omnitrophota bacterium]